MKSHATPEDTYMIIRADGSSKDNQDKDKMRAAYTLIVYQEGVIVDRVHEFLGQKTNSDAEYTGVLESLLRAQDEQVPDGSEIIV